MRSAAHIKGHPVHPALIPFPFAFLSGGFFFDALGTLLDREDWWRTGWNLTGAGILMALVAAVPGFVDYFLAVPPNSTGKSRATRHMLANLSAVALFALVLCLRWDSTGAPSPWMLAIELGAVGLLAVGGWMGGTLVSRNQIGVDHRYAGAGKWRETTVERGAGRPIVAKRDELDVNQMKLVHVDGQRIVLARTEQGYVAFGDRCTHRGASLADGAMICGTVQCPWHGSQFDALTGEIKAGPAKSKIKTFKVEENGSEIRLVL